jgi:orotidine-5'-phosphate decarboxylase
VTSPRDHLIVALDVATAVEAQEVVYELGDAISIYKVGLQLFIAEGPRFVSELVNSGRKVFLDLKLHDIPNTVGGAVRSASELGIHMVTVHASGGSAMLKAAVEASKAAVKGPIILAVTVLTSLSSADLRETGVEADASSQVQLLAKVAQVAGCHGVVSSAQEARSLRKELGPAMAIVTPGIRPTGSEIGDQSRIATPGGAIAAGASHLVVGRPILSAKNRQQAAKEILDEIATALNRQEMKTAG